MSVRPGEVALILIPTLEAPGRMWTKEFVRRLLLNVYTSLQESPTYSVVVEVETERDLATLKGCIKRHKLLSGKTSKSVIKPNDSLDMLTNSNSTSVTFRLNNSRDNGDNFGCGIPMEASMKFPRIQIIKSEDVPSKSHTLEKTETISHLKTVWEKLMEMAPGESAHIAFDTSDFNENGTVVTAKMAKNRVSQIHAKMIAVLKDEVPEGKTKSPRQENFPEFGNTAIDIRQRNNIHTGKFDLYFSLTGERPNKDK